MTAKVLLSCYLIALCIGSSCSPIRPATDFTPIWYNVNPLVHHEFDSLKTWKVTQQAYYAENGSGSSATVMYNPMPNLILGAGMAGVWNKGEIDTTLQAKSRQLQGDLLIGGYYHARRNISFQCLAGLANSYAYSTYNGVNRLSLAYQRMFIQPAINIRFLSRYSVWAHYRVSQLYYTNGKVYFSSIAPNHLDHLRELQSASPIMLGEFSLAVKIKLWGPMQLGAHVSITDPISQTNYQYLHQFCTSSVLSIDLGTLFKRSKIPHKTTSLPK